MGCLTGFMVALIKQELLQSFRSKNQFILISSFFILAVLMFPLSIGPEVSVLLRIGPGIIWVIALFASSLTLHQLFADDFTDGTLEMLFLTNYPLVSFILAKILAHWILVALPILLFSPFVSFCFSMPSWQTISLTFSLGVGTMTFSFLGSMGATLLLGAKRSPFLTVLLVFPLYIPVLIFGTSSLEAAIMGMSLKPPFLMLCSLLLLSIPLSLLVSSLNLRHSLRTL